MRHKSFGRFILALLLTSVATACNSDGPTEGPIPENLVGEWAGLLEGEPVEVQTTDGPKMVRMEWAYTFRADGTYEQRVSLVAGGERADTYVEAGEFSATGERITFEREVWASGNPNATPLPWPQHLVPDQDDRRVDRVPYTYTGVALRLHPPCDDIAASALCVALPALTRQ